MPQLVTIPKEVAEMIQRIDEDPKASEYALYYNFVVKYATDISPEVGKWIDDHRWDYSRAREYGYEIGPSLFDNSSDGVSPVDAKGEPKKRRRASSVS